MPDVHDVLNTPSTHVHDVLNTPRVHDVLTIDTYLLKVILEALCHFYQGETLGFRRKFGYIGTLRRTAPNRWGDYEASA
jgi:hypothetical protein